MTALSWAGLSTPVGQVWVGCSAAGIARVRYGGPAPADGGDNKSGVLADAARQQLADYFRGRRTTFDLPIDWAATTGTQRHVLEVLYGSVGYGETISYGKLASRAGLTAGGSRSARAESPVPAPAPSGSVPTGSAPSGSPPSGSPPSGSPPSGSPPSGSPPSRSAPSRSAPSRSATADPPPDDPRSPASTLPHDPPPTDPLPPAGTLPADPPPATVGDTVPARAVGKIMGSNPIPIVVPCHRVLASDGLGGYSGGAGVEVKRWLLILEGALPPTLDWQPAGPRE